jgi:predicted enzyme related to lactoylglutathione lyase
MPKVTHFEIPADDMDRAQSFYKEVFDWQINPVPGMNYTTVFTGPTDEKRMILEKGFINGGMMKRSGEFKYPDVVIEVEDIESTLKIILEHGGTVVNKKMKVGEMGFSAYFRDTENNMIGLWENA